MSFGISNNVKSEVRECTPDLFNQALDNPQVARICAEIEDALEACRRGELTKEEYETRKAVLKKRLPIFTFLSPPSRTDGARTTMPCRVVSPFMTWTTYRTPGRSGRR